MPRITGGINFIGTLGELSAYKTRWSDKIIVRRKGGPSTHQFKTSPQFERSRENSSEFAGRSKASQAIGRLLMHQKPMADHNINATLNRISRPVQKLDITNVRGKRGVCFSRAPQLLEGFSLNQKTPFDSIVRNPVSCSVSREAFTANLHIPALFPNINFNIPGRHSLYSFVASIGILPDFIFGENGYEPTQKELKVRPVYIQTGWYPCIHGSPAVELELKYREPVPVSDATAAEPEFRYDPPVLNGNTFCVLVAIGICFGVPGANGEVQQVPYAGAGKIIVVV